MSNAYLLSTEGNLPPSVPLQFNTDVLGPAIPEANELDVFGGTQVAGTTPVETTGTLDVLTINVQISQALAAADATKIGLANFDSTSFAVDADGFVTLAGSGAFTWTDVSGAFSPLKNNGYFITATANASFPASPSQGETIKFFVDTTDIFTIQASGSQIVRIGNRVSAAGGSAVSTDRGHSLELTYRASSDCWCSVAGSTGNWILA